MRKNKVKLIIGATVFGVVLLMFCIIRINLRYPNPRLEQVQIGETIERDGIQFEVETADFLSQERVKELWEEEQTIFEETKGYVITIQVTNTSGEEKRLSLGDFILATEAYGQGVDLQRFMEINSQDIKQKFQMQPGESFTCSLPYLIVKEQYTDAQWEKVKEQQYYLILSLYPIKRMVVL